MTVDLEEAEIAALCGYPGAFNELIRALLRERIAAHGDGYGIGRWGFFREEPDARALWWAWPWTLDELAATLAEPKVPPPLRPQLDWLRQVGVAGAPRVELVVPHNITADADALAWLTATLRTRTEHPSLTVVVHGPAEIRRWWAEQARDDGVAPVPVPIVRMRAFGARELTLASCERELVAALDAEAAGGEPVPTALWTVVADELQRHGDPTGESLALALARASAADQPARARALDRAYLDHEAARVARAPTHLQRLADVDARGLSFDAREFERDGLGPAPMLDGFPVRLWAARFGPFCLRMLAQADDPTLAGLGMPEDLLAAPELRYLSPRRHAGLGPDGGDISGHDLSGFRLSPLAHTGGPVHAYRLRLRGADLRGADLGNWRLDAADLRESLGDAQTRLTGGSFMDVLASPELLQLIHAQSHPTQYWAR